ncbi:hypothetical protein ASE92_12260 [Pedobacter sp. Leaf41]|uniref:hypothetical protein n=1 Tax=Pedobacter sp. Leaf41 TaxID=1736218 RepID=UPI0007036A30|nr:hypothetical protein [Pedobacter sp. Leaf41]KQN34370.1 hypothetical protein ASE92_12260 [Pedobacter sp. Leaf41]
MKNLTFIYLIALVTFFSCNTKDKQPEILEAKGGFDLEKVNFQEGVAKLYGNNVILSDGMRYDSAENGKLTDELLKYKISNSLLDAMKITVPQKDFGYLYQSHTSDSLAKFNGYYFSNLNILTDKNKKPVAYHAEGEIYDLKAKKAFLAKMKEKYGAPKYSIFISHHFSQSSYEWALKDRTIQLETSKGFSANFSTDSDAKSGEYLRFDLLIIANDKKEQVHNAHIYEFGDKVLYNGKYLTLEELQLDKKSTFKDVFLLNSTDKKYFNDPTGQYDISREEAE